MKRLLTILILLFLSNTLFSQDYFEFPTSNALWNHIIVESMSPPYEWTVIDSLGQPITIGNQQYIEIYNVGLGTPYVVGAIREDTRLKKVYFHNFADEIILYDFSLDLGDTIFYTTNLWYIMDYYKTVETIDSINICGQYRKRWHLRNSYLNMNDTWIEGIGSVFRYGLLYPNDPDIVLDGSTPYFGCFKHDTITYIDGSTCTGTCPCEGWLVHINEIAETDKEIILYPNPAKRLLHIDLQNSKTSYNYLEIYTYNGEQIQKQEVTSKENIELDLGFLTKGMYFIKLTGKDKVTLRKFVKVK